VSTVGSIIRKWKLHHTTQALPRKGRPSKLSAQTRRRLVREATERPTITLKELQSSVAGSGVMVHQSTDVSTSTVQRRLREAGLTGRIAAKKPLLRVQNKRRRLAWAKKHRNWTFEEWKSILWTEESKFEISGSNHRVFVRRREGERMSSACVVPTVKHGGGSVMVWGCFAGDRVGDLYQVHGKLNQHGCHSILQRHAIPSRLRLVGQFFILQQDNDPKHTSKLSIKVWMEDHQIKTLSWPAQSPDLNPTENLWNVIKRKMDGHKPSNKAELFEFLRQEWHKVTQH
ncbi:TC1A transposase, partial [Polyodon spathula]|nr:TC1A transposase [Polyodon spathula]